MKIWGRKFFYAICSCGNFYNFKHSHNSAFTSPWSIFIVKEIFYEHTANFGLQSKKSEFQEYWTRLNLSFPCIPFNYHFQFQCVSSAAFTVCHSFLQSNGLICRPIVRSAIFLLLPILLSSPLSASAAGCLSPAHDFNRNRKLQIGSDKFFCEWDRVAAFGDARRPYRSWLIWEQETRARGGREVEKKLFFFLGLLLLPVVSPLSVAIISSKREGCCTATYYIKARQTPAACIPYNWLKFPRRINSRNTSWTRSSVSFFFKCESFLFLTWLESTHELSMYQNSRWQKDSSIKNIFNI